MPGQDKKFKVSDILDEMYGPATVESAEPEAPKRQMREGWTPFLAANAARLIGGLASGVVGAVPSLVTTPAAAGIAGAGEALAQKIESPSPLDTTALGIEAGLGAVPFGKLVKTIKPGLSIGKQMLANAGRMAGFIEAGNMIRRKHASDRYLPEGAMETAFDLGTMGLGAGLSSLHPKLSNVPADEVDELDRVLGTMRTDTPGKLIKPETLGGAYDTAVTGKPSGLRVSPAAHPPVAPGQKGRTRVLPSDPIKYAQETNALSVTKTEPLPATIVERLRLIDERPPSSRLMQMLDEEGNPSTPAARELALHEAAQKELQKRQILDRHREAMDARKSKQEAAETLADKENLRNRVGATDLGKIEQAAAKAQTGAAAEQVKTATAQNTAQQRAEELLAREAKVAEQEAKVLAAQRAIDNAIEAEDMVPSPPIIKETTVGVPTGSGKQTMSQVYRPKPDPEAEAAFAELGKSRGPLPVTPVGRPTIPKTDPEVVAKTTYPNQQAAQHAAAGSGRRVQEFQRMGHGKWRVVFEKEAGEVPVAPKPPVEAPAPVVPKAVAAVEPPTAAPAKFTLPQVKEPEVKLQAAQKAGIGPEPVPESVHLQNAAERRLREGVSPTGAERRVAGKAPEALVPAGVGSKSTGNSSMDARLRKQAQAQSRKAAQKPTEAPKPEVKPVTPPVAAKPPVEAPKPLPEAPSVVGKMTKREIDAVTREDVRLWHPRDIKAARIKFPKDKRLMGILQDEVDRRKAINNPVQEEAPKPTAKLAPEAPVAKPVEAVAPKAPEAPVAAVPKLSERGFPQHEGKELSWSLGAYDSWGEKAAGYPKIKAIIASISDIKDGALAKERAEYLKTTGGKQFHPLIDAELAKRTDIPKDVPKPANVKPQAKGFEGPDRVVETPTPTTKNPAGQKLHELSGKELAKRLESDSGPDVEVADAIVNGGHYNKVSKETLQKARNILQADLERRTAKVTVDLTGAATAKEVKNRVVNAIQEYRQKVKAYFDTQGVDEKGQYTYGMANPGKLRIEVPNGPTYTLSPDLTQIDNAISRFEKGIGAEKSASGGKHAAIDPDKAFQGIVDKVERPTHATISTGYGSSFTSKGDTGHAPSVKLPIGPEKPPTPTGGTPKPKAGVRVKAEAKDSPIKGSPESKAKAEAPASKITTLPQRSEASILQERATSMIQRWNKTGADHAALRAELAADPKLQDSVRRHLVAAPDASAQMKAMGVEAKQARPLVEAKPAEGTSKLVDIAQKEKDAWDNYFDLKQGGKATPEEIRAAGKAAGEAKAESIKAVREAIANNEPIPTFLQKHADDIVKKEAGKAPSGTGPTSDDLTKLPPAEQEAALKDIVTKFKSKRGRTDAKGEFTTDLAISAGLSMAGAVAGAAMTPDDPLTGALLGGAAGLAPMAVYRTIANHIESLPTKIKPKSEQALSKYVSDKLKVAAEVAPDYWRASLLSRPQGLLINSFVGPYGAAIMGSLERAIAGDKRGVSALKELLNPMNFSKEWFNKATRAEAKSRVFNSNERGDLLAQGKGPKKFQWLIKQPAEMMTTGDIASRKILMKHGFSETEARQITLTSEPYGKGLSDLVRAGEPSEGLTILKRMALPFFRTTQNQVEQSFMRAPVLGFFAESLFKNAPRSLALKLSQQGVGAGVMGISYAIGAATPKEQRASTLKFITNFGGPYGTLVAMGFMAGYKSQTESDLGKQVESALTEGITSVPLPTTDAAVAGGKAVAQTTIGAFKLALEGKLDEQDIPDLPFGVIPPMLSSKEKASIPSAMRSPTGFLSDKFRPTQKEYSILAPFVDKPELKDLPISASETAKLEQKRALSRQDAKGKEARRQRKKELRNKRRAMELN